MVGSKVSMGDVAIGAGGISAFQNENGGVFKWNEDGTKVRVVSLLQNPITAYNTQFRVHHFLSIDGLHSSGDK
jgi:hypothetical protein